MSASIYYRPLRNEQHIDVAAPSSFIKAMESVFGRYPWKLDGKSVPFLTGMASMTDDGATVNPFVVIIAKIDELGPIEVWPEW